MSDPREGSAVKLPNHTWVVILAGGVGRRFWPRSTPSRPKQCLSFDGEKSLLQHTVARLDGLLPHDRILIVTGQAMEAEVRRQLPQLSQDQFIVEASPKNTAPAIALAAQGVEHRGGRRMVVLPADHRISRVRVFRETLCRATTLAHSRTALVLLGETATRPESGFGYIVPGAACGDAHAVARFIEKPPKQVAEALLSEGALWNSGIFVFTLAAIREAYRAHLPDVWADVETRWDRVAPVSFDHGILEKWPEVAVMPCALGWDDLGTWRAATHTSRVDRLASIDATDIVIDAPGRTVALLGVSDLVIVDTGDVLLITSKDHAHRVDEVRALLDTKREA